VSRILVTGSLGLIGGACSRYYLERGHEVVGVDDDHRSTFFGEDASVSDELTVMSDYNSYEHEWVDIRSKRISDLVKEVDLVVHCAAQPSHDWAYQDPRLDFDINASGTLNILESVREGNPNAMVVYMSTNKVYGDRPNYLPLVEEETRYSHEDPSYGVPEDMSVDSCIHSVFGVSKLSADLMVQEYGKNLGIRTASLRCGCLTGQSHKGAELHGFLSYLSKCVKNGTPYRVFGHKGKQVRDNIHADDVASIVDTIFQDEGCYGEVFNIGGSFNSNISMLEAIDWFENAFGKKLSYEILDENRTGDHIWYISDMSKFQGRYPDWKYGYSHQDLMECFCK